MRLTEYIHYLTHKDCTREWMAANFTHYTPTFKDETLKRELNANKKPQKEKFTKRDIFGE